MHADVRTSDDVTIVDLEGRLVAGTGDQVLHDTMNDLLGKGVTKILLNMAGVVRIDSSGVGELMAGIRLANKVGCRVKLIQGGNRVWDVLNLSRLLPLLDTYPEEKAALAAFATSER